MKIFCSTTDRHYDVDPQNWYSTLGELHEKGERSNAEVEGHALAKLIARGDATPAEHASLTNARYALWLLEKFAENQSPRLRADDEGNVVSADLYVTYKGETIPARLVSFGHIKDSPSVDVEIGSYRSGVTVPLTGNAEVDKRTIDLGMEAASNIQDVEMELDIP